MAIIDDASTVFQCTLYAGTGSEQAITNSGNSDLSADMLWFKNRDEGNSHIFINSVRGVTKGFQGDNTGAEFTDSSYLSSIDSDGFTVNTADNTNYNGSNLVCWQWKEAASVFDIVVYDGNSTNRTISHSLGVVPTMIIFFCITASKNRIVYHQGIGNTHSFILNESATEADVADHFNDTSPTSSVFTVGTNASLNDDNKSYVAYLFGDSSVSKCGLYLGNGSTDGAMVNTNFTPSFVMIKRVAGGNSGWFIYDNKRDSLNPNTAYLAAQVGGTEADGYAVDFLSNGFKLRHADADVNGASTEYVYLAMGAAPIVTSTGVPATAV